MCCHFAASADAGGRAPKGSLGRRRERCRGQSSWGSGSRVGEAIDSAVSCRWHVFDEIAKIRRNFGIGRHGAVSRIEGGRRGGHRGRTRRVRPLLPTP